MPRTASPLSAVVVEVDMSRRIHAVHDVQGPPEQGVGQHEAVYFRGVRSYHIGALIGVFRCAAGPVRIAKAVEAEREGIPGKVGVQFMITPMPA